ncbi:MAG: hypothetical protein JKY88_12965 [Pseudomonadales bacterium]|nr:hypothetical protein [Pseudomonadales bacterium]
MNKNTLVTSSLLLAFWASPVFAYIDPGSGSAIMSAIIGFFLAVSIAIKTYWYKLKSLLGFGKSNTVSDSKVSEGDMGSDKGDG